MNSNPVPQPAQPVTPKAAQPRPLTPQQPGGPARPTQGQSTPTGRPAEQPRK